MFNALHGYMKSERKATLLSDCFWSTRLINSWLCYPKNVVKFNFLWDFKGGKNMRASFSLSVFAVFFSPPIRPFFSLNHNSCGKWATAVSTLIWLWDASIRASHIAQNHILVTRYFSSHRGLSRGINSFCHTEQKPRRLKLISACDLCSNYQVNAKGKHKLTGTTRTGFPSMFSDLAMDTYMAVVGYSFFKNH